MKRMCLALLVCLLAASPAGAQPVPAAPAGQPGDAAAGTPAPVAVPAPVPMLPPPPVSAIAPPPPMVRVQPDLTKPLDLSQASLYVYDFLDVREKAYQPKVLDELERQLLAWLAPRTKAATIIRSKQTPYIQNRDANTWQSDISSEHEVDRVPVVQAIGSNLGAERTFGADYRLILFPSAFTFSGSWRYYTIRFVLIRKADFRSWQYYYEGSHLVMLKEAERSQSRAQKIIEKLDAAMTAAGIVGKKAAEAAAPGK